MNIKEISDQILIEAGIRADHYTEAQRILGINNEYQILIEKIIQKEPATNIANGQQINQIVTTLNNDSIVIDRIIDDVEIVDIKYRYLNNAQQISSEIDWNSPSNGDTLTGTVALSTDVLGPIVPVKINYYLNNVLVSGDITVGPTYSFSLETSEYPNGNYRLKIVATDAAGLTESTSIGVTLDNSIATGKYVIDDVIWNCLDRDSKRCTTCFGNYEQSFDFDEKTITIKNPHIAEYVVTYSRPPITSFVVGDLILGTPPSPTLLPDVFKPLLYLRLAMEQAEIFKPSHVPKIERQLNRLDTLFNNHYGRTFNSHVMTIEGDSDDDCNFEADEISHHQL